MRVLYRILLIALAVGVLFPVGQSRGDDMESIDYWQANYEELKPEANQVAKRAHEIFNRLVKSADIRPGVVPRLFIVKSEPKDVFLPTSIPDGSIIISGKTLAMCWKEPSASDDRLAFVLGRELARLRRGDFYDMKFFSALRSAEAEKPGIAEVFSQIREIVGPAVRLQNEEKNLQFDEVGIIYASMAGFDTRAIVVDDDNVNFFAEWVEAVHPRYWEGMSKLPPEQEAETVRARLKQVLKNVEIFDLGLAFYQTGQFGAAVPAFERFSFYFPSHEVYHYLATSYHQVALTSITIH